MTRRIYVVLALVWGLFVGAFAHASATSAPAKDSYGQERGSSLAPEHIVVRHACIRAEDSAAHLVLVEYDGDKAVYSCDPTSF